MSRVRRSRAFARRALANLEPYVPGRSAEEIAERYGIARVVKLGSNENPLGVSPRVRDALVAAIDRIHHYPDPTCGRLRRRVAGPLGFSPEHVTVANGVDNILTCIGLAFLDPGDRCVIGAPSYSAYASLARVMDAVPVEVPLRDWRFDPAAMAAAARGHPGSRRRPGPGGAGAHAGGPGEPAKMLIVCNPNNPTGTIITHDELTSLVEAAPPDTLVLLDEAYAEWADDPAFPDAPALLRTHANLVITRTFSKIYGLAGLRVGYALAAPEVIACLNQVREPFPVNRLAQAAAEAVLDDAAYTRAALENNRTGRAALGRAFRDLGLRPLPSQANFVLVDLGRPADAIAERLLERGVIIRPGTIWRLPTWARVTVGTPDENARLVEALREALAAA